MSWEPKSGKSSPDGLDVPADGIVIGPLLPQEYVVFLVDVSQDKDKTDPLRNSDASLICLEYSFDGFFEIHEFIPENRFCVVGTNKQDIEQSISSSHKPIIEIQPDWKWSY